MKARSPIATLVVALMFVLAVPTTLMVAPPKAHATLPTIELSGIGTLLVNAYHLVVGTLAKVAVIAQEALQYLFYIKEYVLEPRAFIQSGKASQGLTGAALSFVSSGSANGTGQSIFVQNIPGHLQRAGDASARSFLSQFGSSSNSPYARVITSSLTQNYLQRTSLDGFFSANRCTLSQYSANPNAYLAGNWSQGGISAWFALTTKSENNPYTLYAKTQSQLGLLVSGAQETQAKILSYGKGFLSWCAKDDSYDPSTPTGGDVKETDMGAPCTKKDGTPGTIQTPGSTITAHLDKALGLNADKINAMGNSATQINALVGSIMQSVQMAQDVIGGDQGGLAGVGNADSGGRRLLDDYTNPDTPYAGLDQCSVNKTSAENSPTNGQSILDSSADYVKAWTIIGTAARTAETSVTQLRTTCTANAASTQNTVRKTEITAIATQAQNALDTYITPVLTKANSASVQVASSTAFVQKIRGELAAPGTGTPPVCKDYSATIQYLRTIPPTSTDMATAQQDAIATKTASTTPPGSLVLVTSEGTLVDKMNLLAKNATSLLTSCALP